MKKTYIIPETLIVKVKMQSAILTGSPLTGSGDTLSGSLYDEYASGAGLVKFNAGTFWDEWAGAAGE